MPKTPLRLAAPALAVISAGVAIAVAQAPPSALKPFIENRTLAGAVTLVASPDKVLNIETIGYADIAAKKPMGADALFWIASMSKPITAAALMMLVDEGKVNIEDPVEKYLPEFKGQWLAVEKDKDHLLLKKPDRPITVRDVLTHTSGLPPTSALEKPTLDLFPLVAGARSYAMTPLEFPPGSKYQYSNAGINTAGRIIEVVSGMPYEEFLERRLFAPLGMQDTTFWPAGKQLQRLAKSYKSNREKKDLEETVITQLRYPLDDRRRQPMPAGGLFSTARDVARFCQMVLNGGAFGGKRYLSAAAVGQMTSVQTGDLVIGNGATGYGLGWSVLRREAGDSRGAGSFGHGGAYKTAMWVDPRRQLVMVLMRQHSGEFLTPDGNRIEQVFLKVAIDRFGKATADTHSRVDASTLTGKLIMGYQGWFACPADGHPRGGWVHWFARNSATAATTTVDMLPDVSELASDERCSTGWVSRRGRPVQLFSSQNPKTVARHFEWMKQHGIDGVALQRFVVGVRPSPNSPALDRVLANVRAGAETYGRVFHVMYDVAGAAPENWADRLTEDWARLEAEGVTRGPAYQRHRNRPVLAIAGIGLKDRPATAEATLRVLAALKKISEPYGGITLLGSLPTNWRTIDGDNIADPAWTAVYRSLDVISPWTVGRYRDDAGADRYRKQRLEPDVAEARRLGIDYMPVVFPGFSWWNLMSYRKEAEQRRAATNAIPRRCGRFYWRQVANAVQAGATMLYGAMFDEVDEGTAMFKMVADAQDLPADPPFVSLDADGCALPSNWYLQLAGKAALLLRGGIPISFETPLPLPGR